MNASEYRRYWRGYSDGCHVDAFLAETRGAGGPDRRFSAAYREGYAAGLAEYSEMYALGLQDGHEDAREARTPRLTRVAAPSEGYGYGYLDGYSAQVAEPTSRQAD